MKLEGRLVIISNKIIEYSFYLLAIFTPVFFSPQSYEIFEFPKILLVYTGTAFILTFWIIKMLILGKLNFSPTPLFWPIIAFLTSQIISTIISIDLITSIFGYYSRFNGGLLSQFAFVVLYFAGVSNLKKEQALNLLFLTVVAAAITSVWGIPSHFGADPTCRFLTGVWTSKCWSQNFDPTLRIFATFGQPNWMAGYLAMAILVLTGFYLTISKTLFQATGIILNSILFAAFLLTNSRSAALALFVSLILFLATLIFLKLKQKVKIDFTKVGLTLIIFVILTFSFGQNLLGRVKEVKLLKTVEPQSEVPSQTTTLQGPTESGQIRLIVWKGALQIWKAYPLTGSGVETFGYSYYNIKPAEHNKTSEWNFLYNKAHNEFLNYLATTGVLGLGSFLAIVLVYLFNTVGYLFSSVKRNEARTKILFAGLIIAVFAFLIHNFFGFSVVPTSLYFWIILLSTFCVILPKQKNFKFKPKLLLIFAPFVILIFSLFIIVNFYLADLAFAKGLAKHEAGNYTQAAIDFQKALKSSPLPQPLFLSYAGYNLAILAQGDKDLSNQSASLTTDSLNLSTVNLTTARLAVNTYLELSSYDITYFKETIKLSNHLLKIAPTDAETHFQAALILKIVGEDLEAEKALRKALELRPDYQAAIDTLAEWRELR